MKKKSERHIFTSEELQRMEKFVELQTIREEIIGLLDGYSGSFAGWSVIISKAVQEAMARKQQLNTDCEMERKMLDELSILFAKLAHHGEILSDWHKQLTFKIKNTKEMITQGYP